MSNMKRVLKYEIPLNAISTPVEVLISPLSKFLHFDYQVNEKSELVICVWAEVESELVEEVKVKKKVWIAYTGHKLPENHPIRFINTFILRNPDPKLGCLVMHVYEILEGQI